MSTVKSKDGTTIAYEKKGSGPALILVDGAMCYRKSGPNAALAEQLAPYFTVYTYDRRGRGESTDTAPYTIEREIEDLEALVNAAGGSVFLYGISSGGALALEAAQRIPGVKKLALYELPFIVDDSRPPLPADNVAVFDRLIADSRRGDAVARFMKQVEVPSFFVFLMRFMPVWKTLTSIAHTLPYDLSLTWDKQLGKPLPKDRWTQATIPTIVMDGGKSPIWMRNGMKALSTVLPNAKYRTLDGQTHILKAEAVTPVLREFFAS